MMILRPLKIKSGGSGSAEALNHGDTEAGGYISSALRLSEVEGHGRLASYVNGALHHHHFFL